MPDSWLTGKKLGRKLASLVAFALLASSLPNGVLAAHRSPSAAVRSGKFEVGTYKELTARFGSHSSIKAAKGTEVLAPIPVPALLFHLIQRHRDLGRDLTEAEVLETRDGAPCMMLPVSGKPKLDKGRGYRDIDPKNVWVEWVEFMAHHEDELNPSVER